MSSNVKIVQLSHLLAKGISKTANQEIILDALCDISIPTDCTRLNMHIIDMFGVDIPDNLIKVEIDVLRKQGALSTNASGLISLSDIKRLELEKLKLEESSSSNGAFTAWISNGEIFSELSDNEIKSLKSTIDPFLNRIFVTHGASCFKLLVQDCDATEFDINDIAADVASKYGQDVEFLTSKLPTIFSMTKSTEVLKLLEQKVIKAITYLSSIMPNDVSADLYSRLSGATVYLDTNFIYRLLDLQGESRFVSAKATLKFCQQANVSLRVTIKTYQELTNRIRFDAKILNEHPIKTDLAKFGYTFRTEDNYISSYWRKAAKSHISTRDYNESFADPSIIICKQYGILIEDEDRSDELLEKIQEFYGKITSHSGDYEKSDPAAWHDAYCLATVSAMQRQDATNAVDSKCLFLTTDRQLISLQTVDHELKNHIPLALTPSQLLQLFSFSTSIGDYVETFVTLFSSAAIHRHDVLYTNSDIQEILSRISHYDYYKPEVAESILESQLFRGGYNPDADDAEKEEIIYKAISQELISNLEKEQDDNVKLWENKGELEASLAIKNEEAFQFETERKRNADLIKSKSDENDWLETKEATRRYRKWSFGHILCMCVASLLFIGGIVAVIYLIKYSFQSQISIVPIAQLIGTVIIVGISIPLFRFGFKVTTPNQKSQIIEAYKEEVHSEFIRETNYKNRK